MKRPERKIIVEEYPCNANVTRAQAQALMLGARIRRYRQNWWDWIIDGPPIDTESRSWLESDEAALASLIAWLNDPNDDDRIVKFTTDTNPENNKKDFYKSPGLPTRTPYK